MVQFNLLLLCTIKYIDTCHNFELVTFVCIVNERGRRRCKEKRVVVD